MFKNYKNKIFNNFKIVQMETMIENFGKKIPLENLNYWNVEDQEPYFSYVEACNKREKS